MTVRRFSRKGRRDLAIVAGVGTALLTMTAVAPAVATSTDGNDPDVRGLLSPLVGQPKPTPAPAQPAPAQPAPAPAQPAPAPAQPAPAPAPAPAAAAQQDSYDEGSMELMAQGTAPEPAVPNLVRNGSFEDPASPQTGFVGTFDAIPGWSETTGRGMEIQNRLFAPPEGGGSQYAELASDGPSSFFQEIATEPGKTYRLSFLYSAHPNSGTGGSAFDVTFGPSTMRIDPTPTGLVHWRTTVLEMTATSAVTRLTFSGASQPGQDPGIGAFLDMVEVRALR